MYVGRLAPSPTGYLHLGHAATFLVASERARAAQGSLLLRVDDLDPQRSKEPFVEAAREDLRWLGMSWEAEWRESQRVERYRAEMTRLAGFGLVYPCTCSRKDLLQATQAPHEDSDDEPIYSGRCRPSRISGVQSELELQTGTNFRFRVNEGEQVCFLDGNFGPQCFIAGVDFGDFLVWRKDGLPSYQLACVVDEADMGITEIVRGRDLLRSTARQILLQRALGYAKPAYFHTDLLRDEQGQRLAKRHDALSLRMLRAEGVTPAEIRARVAVSLHHKV